MSEPGDTPLDPVQRAALLAEGLAGGPRPDQRARMAARLAAVAGVSAAALLGAGGGGGSTGGAAGDGAASAADAASAAATASAVAAKPLGLILGALIGGAAIGVTVSELRPRDPVVVTAAARDAGIAPAPADAALDASAALDAMPPADAARTIDASIRSDAGTRPADAAVPADARTPPMSADDLARERRLIDVARSALRSGDLRLAGRSLIEHGMRFPAGALVEEQRVLSIELAVAKRDLPDARRRAAEFRRDYPRSVFLARVDELVPP